MNEYPLISVIIPAYNAENHVKRCLDSVLKQSWQYLDIVLIDDGSSDRTGEVFAAYAAEDPRIRVIHTAHLGISCARNTGIAEALGKYIAFVDADDTADEDYIAYLYSLVKQYQVKMSVCQHRVVFRSRTVGYGSEAEPEVLDAEHCIERMLYRDVIDTSAWGKLYHRSLFEGIRYPEGKLFEDIAVTYRLMIKSGRIAVGYQPKYSYIRHENSIVSGTYTPAKLDLLEMTDRMAADVRENCPALKQAVLCRQVYARFSTLNQMIGAGGVQRERDEVIRFIRDHASEILKDARVPGMDSTAVRLLRMGYPLYRTVWLLYRRNRI